MMRVATTASVPRAALFLLIGGVAFAGFSLTFTHLAGSAGGPGFEDGEGAAARFHKPAGIAVSAGGDVFISDTENHVIRKMSSTGAVSTMAGLAQTSGSSLTGARSHARFNFPGGLAVDGAGNVYVADHRNHAIRRITPTGVMTTFAGSPGFAGNTNANGINARFSGPSDVAFDAAGNLYVADTNNHRIRRIAPNGDVIHFAGTGSFGTQNGVGTLASFNRPEGIAFDATTSSLFVADTGNRVVRRISIPSAQVTTFAGTMSTFGHADGSPGIFGSPAGIDVSASGTVYVADKGTHVIRAVTPGGTVSTIAGQAHSSGADDGAGDTSRFFLPSALAVSGNTLFVADTFNNTVRKIEVSATPETTTVAGLAQESGNQAGTALTARFSNPGGLAFYPGPRRTYVADTGNNVIKKVTATGDTTVLAGSIFGYAEGTGATARFRQPRGLAVYINDGSIYIADTGNHVIRHMTADGLTTLVAGQPFVSGNANGNRLTSASFKSPQAVALSGQVIYVADSGNFLVRKIDLATGEVTTVAGSGVIGSTDANGTSASFNDLTGIHADSSDNVYVTDSRFLRKISAAGDVTTIAEATFGSLATDGVGNAAKFGYPGPTAISGHPFFATAYIADPRANLIRTFNRDTNEIGTLGGSVGRPGIVDGTGSFARFNFPNIVAGYFDPVFVDGHAIRQSNSELADRATIDDATGPVGILRQLDAAPASATAWEWSIIRRPAGSAATLSATNVRNPTFTPDISDLYVFRVKATGAFGSMSISTVSLTANHAASALSFSAVSPTAGVPFDIAVSAVDGFGNVDDTYTGTVHFTSTDPQATLPSDYTFTAADNGTHTFSVTLRKAPLTGPATRTITVTDVSTASMTGTTTLTIKPGPAFAIMPFGTIVTAGEPWSPYLIMRDEFGNLATTYRGTIHFTSSDPTATLPPDYTFTANDGGAHPYYPQTIVLNTYGEQTVTATDIANSSLSRTETMTVHPPAPGSFSATALTTTRVMVTWTAPPDVAEYELYRFANVPGGGWPYMVMLTGTSYDDTTVVPGVSYQYRIRAFDSSGAASRYLFEVATTIFFTDDPLLSGTPVKAVHVNELRQAVDAMRLLAAMSPATFTDNIAPGVDVKAVHFSEMQTMLRDARISRNMDSFFTVSPAPGQTIIAAVVNQLRDHVK